MKMRENPVEDNPFQVTGKMIDAEPQNVVLGAGQNWGHIVMQCKQHVRPFEVSDWGQRDGLSLNFVLQGKGILRESGTGKPYELRPGVLYHNLPGHPAKLAMDESQPFTEFYLIFDRHIQEALELLKLIPSQHALDAGIRPSILEEFLQLKTLCEPPITMLKRRRILTQSIQFLTDLYERAQTMPGEGYWQQKIHEAVRLMDSELERPREEELRLEEIAGDVGVSATSFRRHFHEVMGCSPGTYRVRKRIDRACWLLVYSSVSETADELGYRDAFTFSAQFKKYMGVSPRAFKENLGRPGHPEIVS